MSNCKKCGNVCANGKVKCNMCVRKRVNLTQLEIDATMLELCAVEE